MDRRTFIGSVASGLLAVPIAARGQKSAIPVIGLLVPAGGGENSYVMVALRRGLSETGYVEGKDVAIEFRRAEGHHDQLPGMAADLVSRHVAILVTFGGSVSARAAKAATATIPIVFVGVFDRVGALVAVGDIFLSSRGNLSAGLAVRHAVPTMFEARDSVAAGGLMSYGANLSETYRQVGIYPGRILNGAKPADLPVLQPTTF